MIPVAKRGGNLPEFPKATEELYKTQKTTVIRRVWTTFLPNELERLFGLKIDETGRRAKTKQIRLKKILLSKII